MNSAPLTAVKGIGPATAKLLSEHGIKSVEDLRAVRVKVLVRIPGFSRVRARAVRIAAKELIIEQGSGKNGQGKKSRKGNDAERKKKGKKAKRKEKDKGKAKSKSKKKDKGKAKSKGKTKGKGKAKRGKN